MIEVLLVSESSDYCETLRSMLDEDREIIPIGEANNGGDTLEFCEIILPDLILVSLGTPNLDGITVTRQIKAKYPQVKILVMIESGTDEDLAKALDAGADGYLLKPIEALKATEAIKSTINGIPTIDPHIFIPVKT